MDAILNLGAGVQSTTMLLMAAAGEITPMPAAAIFADTGAEPAATYAHLDFLRRCVGERIEIVTVTGGNLRADIEQLHAGERTRLSNPPVFSARPAGRPGSAPALRACTRDYKIRPIEREIRRRGYGRDRLVEQWIGISLDEVERMKRAEQAWITTRWPLIEQRMTRHDCLRWLTENGYPQPPKSACTFCPYHSDAAWRDLRDNTPGRMGRRRDRGRDDPRVARDARRDVPAPVVGPARRRRHPVARGPRADGARPRRRRGRVRRRVLHVTSDRAGSITVRSSTWEA